MELNSLPDNPYLLLTPGPLSTSKTVKAVMLRDWCTWDDDYNHNIVQEIRGRLVQLASRNPENYTSVLMQGSGSFGVESVIGSAVPADGKLLVIANGAYGTRMVQIAQALKINHLVYALSEVNPPEIGELKRMLDENPDITHLAVVHCETTTGILNPVREVLAEAKSRNIVCILDAMSSFGGIPLDMRDWGADFLISSPNKCIQGVPGFSFIIADKHELAKCEGQARSLSLDLYDQWNTMENGGGKWRFTSPTHVVRAFLQALLELEQEGGVEKRFERYCTNQKTLVSGMRSIGFETLLPDELHSPIITSFRSPSSEKYVFKELYDRLKEKGFVIYPGKVTQGDTFRIGNIGEVYPSDMEMLVQTIGQVKFW
ncbi:2-aminoethylphosphonate--pyruvate transaminase [Mangrovibacterium diazotrophicum]|uniref:2-aminoethylphosphonate--pyruvate transaminase n=1 Tax=Mangrovibacterium diazotrophicum TaxID=1261403 RepID=A0A419VYV8_9BACT|nr:2-aminoethylphosphonate--pyruvate transaminase [Mangrovibacterium diazotrophicum]RKD88250.1 2-aminoethylphosphonate--pyruvate transaminase [Mangrovibacterium diazotrophicum]